MIIADIGINHNGSLKIALDLIKQCKDIGVDIVKFQKRNPDICVPESYKYIEKDSIFGKMPYLEYKKKIEFGKAEYDVIDAYCKELDIKWTASIWDEDSLNFILQYNVPFIKIPSACITKLDLLNKLAATDKNVILATGMCTELDIENAVNILDTKLISLLHCVSTYPTDFIDSNISYINILKEKYKDKAFSIGYSGHELGYIPTLMARTLGCSVIERHITLDNNMAGTDHKASLNINDFKNMLDALKVVDQSLGQPYKVFNDSEKAVAVKLIY